ncbi:hypothetical protein CSKR_110839 [Clonorchis sinensis]|uniref:Uncharacterized protein n=1 Tax=Clonorchis sinensis TaxID=79923 RepID=A0A419Q3R3_CLOSI|nr:hypothetical protein CSKR_110839 [Clonorchis sinensis]
MLQLNDCFCQLWSSVILLAMPPNEGMKNLTVTQQIRLYEQRCKTFGRAILEASRMNDFELAKLLLRKKKKLVEVVGLLRQGGCVKYVLRPSLLNANFKKPLLSEAELTDHLLTETELDIFKTNSVGISSSSSSTTQYQCSTLLYRIKNLKVDSPIAVCFSQSITDNCIKANRLETDFHQNGLRGLSQLRIEQKVPDEPIPLLIAKVPHGYWDKRWSQ